MIWFQGTKRGSAGSHQETVETIIIEKVMGNLMQGGGTMIIVYLTLRYRAPWCRSLKDKRSQVRGIQAALKNKFNVSVAECGAQNSRTLFDIAVAALAADSAQADSIRESIQRFAEDAAEAELYDVLAERR